MESDSIDAKVIDSKYVFYIYAHISYRFVASLKFLLNCELRLRISATDSSIGVLNIPVKSLIYDMKHSQRGKCLIFNHQTFDSNTGCRPRLGTDRDANSIAQCFHKLEFDVIHFMDASYRDIRDALIKGYKIFKLMSNLITI